MWFLFIDVSGMLQQLYFFQGVALSARMLQCRAVIVMPLATPSIKVDSVRMHGGPTVEVRLFGNNYDEAAAEATRLQKEENMIRQRDKNSLHWHGL